MEDNTNTGISIFEQICEVNELDPQEIIQKAKERYPEKSSDGKDAEMLIRTAFEERANNLLKGINAAVSAEDKAATGGKIYTIDPYPAAPAFMLHEEYIRSAYSEDEAAKIIKALEQVQLPVTG